MAKDLANTFKEVVSYREQQLALLNEISLDHQKLKALQDKNEMDPVYEQIKLHYKDLYVTSSLELQRLSESLDKLKRILARRETKIKKRKTIDDPTLDMDISALSESKRLSTAPRKGDIWNHEGTILPKGSQVAALVDQHSVPRLWILASIRSYSAERDRYEVMDEDAGDEKNEPLKKVYTLDATKIVPLPSLQDVPLTVRRQFARNERVLAIYPGTTVLYPSLVIQAPRKTKTDDYVLLFDDDEGQNRIVNATYVIPFPANYYEMVSS